MRAKLCIMKSINKILIINIIVFVSTLLIFHSCQKIDLDYSNINSVELSGEWGVPLVNTTYYADQVLNVLDANNFTQRPDGMLQYTYNISADNIIKGDELMTLNEVLHAVKHYSFVVPPANLGSTIPINGLSFTESIIIDNRKFQIRNGEIKSGTLQFEINHNITQIDSVVISTHNLLDRNQQFFTYTIRGGYSYQSIDVAGYKVLPNNDSVNNAVTFKTKIYGSVPSSLQQGNYYVDLDIQALQIKLKYVFGKLSPQYVHVSEMVPVRVFSDNFSGSIHLLNPIYHINVENSFGAQLGFVVDTAGFCSNDAQYSSVMSQGSYVTCQAAPSRGVFAHNQQQYSQNSVYYNERYNDFKLSGQIIVNPHGYSAGNIFVDETSTINIHTDLEIPFQANLEYLEFCDTTGNILEALQKDGSVNNYANAIKKLTMKCGFTNGMPVMANAQLLFVDTNHTQYVIVDSLMSHPQILVSATTGQDGKVTAPTTSQNSVELNGEKLDKILSQSNNTVLRIRVYADKPVKIYTSQFVKAIIGMKVEYDTQDVTLDL